MKIVYLLFYTGVTVIAAPVDSPGHRLANVNAREASDDITGWGRNGNEGGTIGNRGILAVRNDLLDGDFVAAIDLIPRDSSTRQVQQQQQPRQADLSHRTRQPYEVESITSPRNSWKRTSLADEIDMPTVRRADLPKTGQPDGTMNAIDLPKGNWKRTTDLPHGTWSPADGPDGTAGPRGGWKRNQDAPHGSWSPADAVVGTTEGVDGPHNSWKRA